MSDKYRYSFWDGTQTLPELDADTLMSAIADDLLNHGDLEHALRSLMQRGIRSPQMNMRGITDYVRQLREERRKRLEQYNLGGVMEDIQRQLEEVLAAERAGIDALRQEAEANAAGEQAGAGNPDADAPEGNDAPGGPDETGKGGDRDASGRADQQRAAGNAADPGNPGKTGQRRQSGVAGHPPGDDFASRFSQKLMRDLAADKQQYLDRLPETPAGQVKALQDYEFLSPEAKEKFDKLLEQLRKAVTESFFKDMKQMVQRMSDGDMARMKEMMKALNEMLAQRIDGQEPDFDKFMQQFGDMFGPNPPKSLDELLQQMREQMAAMQSLMASRSEAQREQLQELFADKFGDPQLEVEMMRLSQRMHMLNPEPNAYPFRGDTPVDLESAMQLMREMQDIDQLAKDLQRLQYGAGDIDQIDLDKLRNLLGDEAADQLGQMKDLKKTLEDAGLIRNENGNWEVTPRGNKMIGQKSLGEIYSQLKKHALGNHPVSRDGRLGERTDETKPYEFGDPFHLHMTRTLRNALEREGRGSPIRLQPDDFEIYRNELVTRTATVLMVDLSWSMARRGAFHAAKKVALALHQLISSQFPRDSLYLVGFSAYARELKAHELPQLHWDEYMLGTNIQHALQIADRLLARHSGGTRQVIMITDGEPTSHMEDGVAQFSYPPSPVTIRETLRAVHQCSKRNITINTFMLDQSYYLKEFVESLTRINGGRAFYTTPEQLGEYILADYVTHRRKKIART